MTSETLTTELERYRIGPRIKALRLKKKLGLVQLSQHTGLSTAMLSKIERGQLFPTLPTLLRIALVFGVDLDHFFNKGGPRIAVTRKSERVRLPIPAGTTPPSYVFESLDYPLPERKMEGFLADFPEGASSSEPHQHGVEEIVYVLVGTLCVTVDGEVTTLQEGDAISFDSGAVHSYEREGEGPCKAIVVTVS
ncbi:XRE family transcriptional regulator [Neorhizobium sp. T786]|uniref:helix-turn-helix domain-containing protein n=1 Tax=Pseudorhizobium xiangyangii TaxID=2883104 RepID=UPI001CFFD73A|nr:XRE family transcriptional regulator [Neorhizobium xiangyangii]MCB5203792.1 XRE family transcriptional regulator [Neorhizobium xiangyangii]